MRRIADAFRRSKGEGVLIAYLMGGDPNPDLSLKAVGAAVAGGADIVELGIPFSDPIADGRTIQAAGVRALSSGTRPSDVMRIARAASRDYSVPVVLMTYLNILQAMGVERFLEGAKRSGVDGVIVPDLPVEESERYCMEAKRTGIDFVLLAAPTTSPERMRVLARRTSGFLYLVSLLGVTGARADLDREAPKLVSWAKVCVGERVPLAVGFGISKPRHVRQVLDGGADAAIVGSAIVERVAGHLGDSESMLKDVEEYVRLMKRATRFSQK